MKNKILVKFKKQNSILLQKKICELSERKKRGPKMRNYTVLMVDYIICPPFH